MYYFAYCTYLDEELARQRLPGKFEFITKARAVGHTLQFRTAGARDRGWCHLSNGPDAFGQSCLGIVYEVGDRPRGSGHDHYERIYFTVHGDDGKAYDCYGSRLVTPGAPMRLPDADWEHVRVGLRRWQFPETYIRFVEKLHDEAAPSLV